MEKFYVLIALLIETNLFAQIIEQKLFASDGVNGNLFGYSVALSDSFAFVGAPGDDENGAGSGSVYIFKKGQNNWTETQKIVASNGSAGDEFGTAVSVDSNYLIIGAPRANSLSGLVYVFKREEELWSEVQILSPPSSLSGISVSISGSYILIGSDELASIYKLENSQWIFKQTIISSDYSVADLFGYSVSIDADNALVGAYFDDNENGWNAGSAYLFTRDEENWIETQKIIASDNLAGNFGYSLQLNGNTAIIGAPWDTTFTILNGSAFIYNFNNGLLMSEQKILPSDWEFDGRFGNAVSILGDVAVVGAFGVNLSSYDVGSAYIFKKENGNWLELQKFMPSDEITDLQYGSSVALNQHNILIGAPATYAQEDTLGLAYIYDGIIVSVNHQVLPILNLYKLEQNYPNPFNPATTIRYKLPQDGVVTIKIFDVLGREIATLVNEKKTAGSYEVDFSAQDLTSGVYIYRMKVNEFIQSKKMLLLR